MTIRDILQAKPLGVATARPSLRVKDTADQMRHARVGALVLTIGSTIAGVVSERDIVHALSEHGSHALEMTAGQIAPRTIITISPEDRLTRAMQLMTCHRVRHLPVLENGALAGIVSLGDVVKQRLEDMELEMNVLRDVYIAAH